MDAGFACANVADKRAPRLQPTSGSVTAGIACVTAGMVLLTINDALAKALGAHYSPLVIVFMRMVMALPVVALVLWSVFGWRIFRTRTPLVHIGRGLLAVASSYLFFLGLTRVPLAEATAIAFAAPLFVTALSGAFLADRVGPHRWLATLAGFGGVVLILQPGGDAFQPGGLVIVGTAFLYALLMITARWIDSAERVWTVMIYMGLVPLVVSGALMPWAWTTPSPGHLPHFLAMGLCVMAAMTLITQGFRLAPAATVAPFDYTGLLWATLLGWWFWSEVPGPLSAVGALLIVASGLYIIARESRAKRPRARAEEVAAEPKE